MVEKVIFPMKTLQAIAGTNAATYKAHGGPFNPPNEHDLGFEESHPVTLHRHLHPPHHPRLPRRVGRRSGERYVL